jgi:hypothetical protein
VIYRDINLRKDLPRVVIESMTLVGAILTIMACAVGFTGFLIQAQVPMKLLELMQSLITSQFIFLLVLNIFLVIVGMLMEIFAAIVVAVPLVIPLARAYGLDPYHFAIIFLLNLEIAYLMPPLGINLFISSIRFNRPVTSLYTSVLSFIGVLFATLMVVSYVPILTTWLPSKVQSDEFQGGEDIGAEPLGGDDLKDEDFGLTGDDLDTKDGGVADAAAAEGGSVAAIGDGGTAAAEPPKEEPPKPLTKAEKAQARKEAAAAKREAARIAREEAKAKRDAKRAPTKKPAAEEAAE